MKVSTLRGFTVERNTGFCKLVVVSKCKIETTHKINEIKHCSNIPIIGSSWPDSTFCN